MLTNNDIDFLVMCLDKTPYNGLKTAHQVVEVFIKLKQMREDNDKLQPPKEPEVED